MVKLKIAAALQVAGGMALAGAGFLVSPMVGLMVLGVIAIVFGVALEHEATARVEVAAPSEQENDDAGEELPVREKRGEG